MNIKRAEERHRQGIEELLMQVLRVHHKGRPDLFRPQGMKYTKEQLIGILHDDMRPVFVAVDEAENVKGYAFCMFEMYEEHNIMRDHKTLYIDDLCVDENCRGQHIGSHLYEYVLDYAKNNGCYNVTLNVWDCNEAAAKFYQKCGLKTQKTGMEIIL